MDKQCKTYSGLINSDTHKGIGAAQLSNVVDWGRDAGGLTWSVKYTSDCRALAREALVRYTA